MLSNVVIYYWSCDFLSSRNLTGLPSFLGFLSLPVCTHRLRQRRRWRSYALGHGGAVSLDDLWSKNGARHSQWRRWTQKNQLRDNALALTGFLNDLTMYLYLFFDIICAMPSEQIRRFAPTCWKENKRFRIPSSSWRRRFAMLRTPLSFLFQGHCLRQGNFHYASRDAGTTWDAWVSTAVTRRTAVEPMSLLAITTCRSQCSSSLEILLYAAVQYDPRRSRNFTKVMTSEWSLGKQILLPI